MIHNLAAYCPTCLRVECRCTKFGASIVSSQDEPSDEVRVEIMRRTRELREAKRAADNREPPPVEIQIAGGSVRYGRTGSTMY